MKIVKADTHELKEKAFAIRKEVFVIEQKVDTRDEFDEFEEISKHFVALNDQDEPIGAARWRQTEKGVKLERFAVKANMRSNKVGSALVQTVLEDIQKQLGAGVHLYLHAQLPAVGLYEKFGFEKKGDQFSECDILHYYMHRLS